MAVAVQPSQPLPAPAASGTGLLPVDIVLLGYLGVVTAVAVHRASIQPGCWWLVLANGLAAMLIVLMSQAGLGRAGRPHPRTTTGRRHRRSTTPGSSRSTGKWPGPPPSG